MAKFLREKTSTVFMIFHSIANLFLQWCGQGQARQGLGPANCLLCPVIVISKPIINTFISIHKQGKHANTTYTVTMTLRFSLDITACCLQAATKTHNQ